MKRFSVALALTLLLGCQSTRTAYYNAWEKMGYAKRERLVDDVKDAKTSQENAKKQFATALEEFRSVTNFKGTANLEKAYDKLNTQYQKSETQVGKVKDKIATVKNVSQSLFSEWRSEIDQIQGDANLKAESQKLYDQTKSNYESLIVRMDRAAASMDPVVQKFKNRVLFLKSNLNAQALASLAGMEGDLSADIGAAIKDMEAAIAEADAFITQNQGK